MGTLVVYALAGGLFLALEVLWCRPVRPHPTLSVAGRSAPPPEPAAGESDWDPATVPFLHDRLDAVCAEMERIEDDDEIYGRAFRYEVCKVARDALLTDLSRLARAHRPSDGHRPEVESQADVIDLEASLAGPAGTAWEELTV